MDLAELRAQCRAGTRHKYVFFWGHEAPREGVLGSFCLSHWYPAPFLVEGTRYATGEHFMMAEKARLFGDEEARSRILGAAHPGAAKQLGRQVQGFEPETWVAHRVDIVVRGNEAKFRQNDALGSYLVNTKERVLAEASPQDRVWGIGLTAVDERAANPLAWEGQNLLGFALMEVRGRLRSR